VTASIELPDGYVWRLAERDDLPGAQALLDACEAAVTGEPRPHQLDVVAEAALPGHDLARDFLLIATDVGTLAAFGWLLGFDSGNSVCEPNVHPEHTRSGLEGPLLTALEERAAEHAASIGVASRARVSVWCEDVEHERRALLLGRGYRKVRDFFIMRIDLAKGFDAAAVPEGVEIRAFHSGRDERTLYEATQEAFAEHFNFEPESFDDFVAEWTGRDVVPGLWLVAWDGDDVAGEVAAVRRERDVYIESVSVRKPWRGRGLALAMLLLEFEGLHARGLDDVFLGVDAENATGAVQLYERAGMHVWRRFELFERMV